MVKVTSQRLVALLRTSTIIAHVAGRSFIEDPHYGDEMPLFMYDGRDFYMTDFWEAPDVEDVLAMG